MDEQKGDRDQHKSELDIERLSQVVHELTRAAADIGEIFRLTLRQRGPVSAEAETADQPKDKGGETGDQTKGDDESKSKRKYRFPLIAAASVASAAIALSTVRSLLQKRGPTGKQREAAPPPETEAEPDPPSPEPRHEPFQDWKLSGSGDLERGDGELTVAAGSELGLAYNAARGFNDFHMRLQYRPESSDFDMSAAVRFLDPQQPVPDRDDPEVVYPYDNQAFVAAHTGFAVHLGAKRPGADTGTFEGVLLGDAAGAQRHAERAEVKIGDWNDLELDVEGDRFSVRLNGKETAQFTNSDSYRGKPASASPHAGLVGLLIRKGRMTMRQVEVEERTLTEEAYG